MSAVLVGGLVHQDVSYWPAHQPTYGHQRFEHKKGRKNMQIYYI